MYKFLIIIIIILLIHLFLNQFSRLKKHKKIKTQTPQKLPVNSSPQHNNNLKSEESTYQNETDFLNNIENNLLEDLLLNN